MTENEIARKIVHAAYLVHTRLGPGLLESAYEACLAYELVRCGLEISKQVKIPLRYDEIELDYSYRINLLVEDKVIIELKSVNELHNIHTAQILTYLKLTDCKLGILINFNVSTIKDGIKRIINGYLGST